MARRSKALTSGRMVSALGSAEHAQSTLVSRSVSGTEIGEGSGFTGKNLGFLNRAVKRILLGAQ